MDGLKTQPKFLEMPFTEALAKKQAAIDAMRLQKAQALEWHWNLCRLSISV